MTTIPDLSRIFAEYAVNTAAARAIVEAVNAEVEAMAARVAELERRLEAKPDKADTHMRAHARGLNFMKGAGP